MSSLESSSPVPKFESRKDFMEYLGDLMTASFEEDVSGEGRGRPRLLKSYMMEANSEIPEEFDTTSLKMRRIATNLPEISILLLNYGNTRARFYVDTSDKRFWILHSNDLAEDTNALFKRLVFTPDASFDRAWLPTEMMQKVVSLSGNRFRGFGLRYEDLFSENDQAEQPVEELRMRVSGSSSIDALEALKEKRKLRRSISYSMVRVSRGDRLSYSIQELGYRGRFIAKGGSSIDDYISLLEMTRRMYRNTVERIEKSSIGVKEVQGRTLVRGQAFDLTVEREIEHIDSFIDHLVNSKNPFRLWGIKNKIQDNLCQVICVDLHTGDSINLEVSPSLIRIYLPEGSCGNTVLRIYANLQHYYDSAIKLNDEPLQVNK